MRWKAVAIACGLLVLAVPAFLHAVLRGSLPQLDGRATVSGVAASVTIERDKLGVVTVTAANRTDLAYGTGYVHAQDRFFQMDVSRRLAAGELSALVGPATVEQDRQARLFQFRRVAQQVLGQAAAPLRAVLEAYARGVNDGLRALRSRPWEYWALGTPPSVWKPEDSILVVHAMWWQLQYMGIQREIARRELNERLGGALCGLEWKCALSFFYPPRTSWDATAVGPPERAMEPLPIPSRAVIDIRGRGATELSSQPPPLLASVGSNNWAVAGALTATGSALVANDMHLTQRVPDAWYHARLRVTGSQQVAGLDVTGVTLPGAPLVVAGSNGNIAWGFTNSYGTWLDVHLVPCTAAGEGLLQTRGAAVPLSVEHESIEVRGAPPVPLAVRHGAAGLLFQAHPERQRCWFVDWLAQSPAATNLNLMSLERATSTGQALALAPTIGIPHQNAIIGDRDGHIGWAIFGKVPRDTGPNRNDGRSAWTDAANHPSQLDPPSGRLWSANSRVTADAAQELAIGAAAASLGAQYDIGARAGQIRDDLRALGRPVTPADMLRIQLDDRAIFLARWRALLLTLLDEPALQGHSQRALLRRLVAGWDARAAVDSTGYRLLRTWHDRMEGAVWSMIVQGLGIPPDATAPVPMQFEEPLWRLVTEKPEHLLSTRYVSWRAFMLAQLDTVLAQLHLECGGLSQCTWGRQNVVRIAHPLSPGLPAWLARVLDMPPVALAGDTDMPRVQTLHLGASERFAVSPGHEDQGYFHMAGGQSGNPLSPYYRAGFAEWVRGVPLPFLPGQAQHTLTLEPN